MSALLEYPTGTIELEVDMLIGSSSSSWDNAAFDFAQWGTEVAGAWVDVTCDISELTVTAGADKPDGLVTALNGTTGGITLHGSQYNPWAPPWGRNVLGPAVPVRVLWRHAGAATWSTAFTGVTDGWPYDRDAAIAAVPVLDATGGLANLDLATLAAPVGQHETLTARMNRILDAATWSTGLRALSPDGRTVISTDLGAAAWDMLQTAADTGLGLLWIKRTGEVAYLPVGQAGGWTPHLRPEKLTDTDTGDPAELCVANFTNSDPEVVRNIVTVSRSADDLVDGDTPAPATAEDPTSVTRYGPHTYNRTDLIHDTDSWSSTVAAAVLMDSAWPLLHPESADLDIRIDTRVADLLLGAEIGDVITVIDSGQTFECAVVGWSFDLNSKHLTGTLTLSDVTRWVGYGWDMAGWDKATWGV